VTNATIAYRRLSDIIFSSWNKKKKNEPIVSI
jgi:hypothetical protein